MSNVFAVQQEGLRWCFKYAGTAGDIGKMREAIFLSATTVSKILSCGNEKYFLFWSGWVGAQHDLEMLSKILSGKAGICILGQVQVQKKEGKKKTLEKCFWTSTVSCFRILCSNYCYIVIKCCRLFIV